MKVNELKYNDGEVVYNIKENRFIKLRVIVVGIQDNEDFYGIFEFNKKKKSLHTSSGFNLETNYCPIKLEDVISKSEYRKRVIKDLL